MGPILYAHEHEYKIFILQALSTISTCAYMRDFTVQNHRRNYTGPLSEELAVT